MISAPIYEYNLKGALAHGYLSVRLVGMDSIILSCTVLVCDVCDEGCSKLTVKMLSQF